MRSAARPSRGEPATPEPAKAICISRTEITEAEGGEEWHRICGEIGAEFCGQRQGTFGVPDAERLLEESPWAQVVIVEHMDIVRSGLSKTPDGRMRPIRSQAATLRLLTFLEDRDIRLVVLDDPPFDSALPYTIREAWEIGERVRKEGRAVGVREFQKAAKAEGRPTGRAPKPPCSNCGHPVVKSEKSRNGKGGHVKGKDGRPRACSYCACPAYQE